MNERIDQFCEILRVKLTSIDNNMQALKAKIDSKARTAEQDVQSHLDSVKKHIAQDHTKLAAAQADIKKWTEERKAVTDEKIAEWKAKLEKAKLKGRAEAAERYAAGAAVVASAAVDEAEQAGWKPGWRARTPTVRRTRKRSERRHFLRRRLVAEEPLAGLAAEVARVAHLLEQRTGAVFRIVETVVERLHDVEHDVEADEVGEHSGPSGG